MNFDLTITDIFFISCLLLSIELITNRIIKRNPTIRERLAHIGAGIFLTALSLIVKYEKIGGTLLTMYRGWPHSYYICDIKEVGENIPAEKACFMFGPFYSYLLSDIFFYFCLTSLLYSLFKWMKKMRHTPQSLRR